MWGWFKSSVDISIYPSHHYSILDRGWSLTLTGLEPLVFLEPWFWILLVVSVIHPLLGSCTYPWVWGIRFWLWSQPLLSSVTLCFIWFLAQLLLSILQYPLIGEYSEDCDLWVLYYKDHTSVEVLRLKIRAHLDSGSPD